MAQFNHHKSAIESQSQTIKSQIITATTTAARAPIDHSLCRCSLNSRSPKLPHALPSCRCRCTSQSPLSPVSSVCSISCSSGPINLDTPTIPAHLSYGVVVNSFYELEPVYANYYRNGLGRKAWHIGPVSLCNIGPVSKCYSSLSMRMLLLYLIQMKYAVFCHSMAFNMIRSKKETS